MTTETLSISSATPKRLSLPLSSSDLADLMLIRESPERLRALPGSLDDTSSDAALVHAVFVAGLIRIREEVEAAGYTALAEDAEYTEYHAARRDAAGRRRSE